MTSFLPVGGLRKGSVRRSARWAVPMAPAILLIGAFLAVPIGYSIYLSLTNTRLTGVEARAPKFVGLDNFTKLFGSDAFPKAAWLTLLFVVGSALIGQNLLGLALALLMQKRTRLVRTAVGITVLAAYVFPEIVPGFMWTSFLNENGVLNSVLRFFHLPPQQLLVDQPMVGVILADVWRATAFSMLVYTAALGDVPEELIEAAEIDGAGYTKVLRYVISPLLRRTAFTNLMLITLPTMSVFTMVFVLTGGGPGAESETLPLLMYHKAFQFGELGYGTAISVVLLGFGGLLSLLYVIALRPGHGD